MDHALGDQPVGLPRLAVVGEVRADDPLEVHPQVAVVVLVREAATWTRTVTIVPPLRVTYDRRAEGLAARVLEDDVGVLAAGQLADPRAEPVPLLRVLRAPRRVQNR